MCATCICVCTCVVDTACAIDDDYLYLFGTPCGRLGSARLLRVPKSTILLGATYEYYTGTNTSGFPVWSTSQTDASVVIDGSVGELSVTWVPVLRRWLAAFTVPYSAIVYRLSEGACLWGPYTNGTTLLDFSSHNDFVYGAFSHPALIRNLSVAATSSFYTQYEVFTTAYNLPGAE